MKVPVVAVRVTIAKRRRRVKDLPNRKALMKNHVKEDLVKGLTIRRDQ